MTSVTSFTNNETNVQRQRTELAGSSPYLGQNSAPQHDIRKPPPVVQFTSRKFSSMSFVFIRPETVLVINIGKHLKIANLRRNALV